MIDRNATEQINRRQRDEKRRRYWINIGWMCCGIIPGSALGAIVKSAARVPRLNFIVVVIVGVTAASALAFAIRREPMRTVASFAAIGLITQLFV